MESNLFTLENITLAKKFSNKKITQLRRSLLKLLSRELKKDIHFTIITGGSFARREASSQSDIDFFIICGSDKEKEQITSCFDKISMISLSAHPRQMGLLTKLKSLIL